MKELLKSFLIVLISVLIVEVCILTVTPHIGVNNTLALIGFFMLILTIMLLLLAYHL